METLRMAVEGLWVEDLLHYCPTASLLYDYGERAYPNPHSNEIKRLQSRDMHLDRLRFSICRLDKGQIRNLAVRVVRHQPRTVRLRLERRPRLEHELAVHGLGAGDMHFDRASPRLARLDVDEVLPDAAGGRTSGIRGEKVCTVCLRPEDCTGLEDALPEIGIAAGDVNLGLTGASMAGLDIDEVEIA